MVKAVRFGFDIEARQFSMEYIRKRFEYLDKKVDLLEIPVYKFAAHGKVDAQLLKEFLDISASYNFHFTAHASDDLELITAFEPDDHYIKRVKINIEIAERIGAEKIVFHHKTRQGVPLKPESNILLCIENGSELDPFLTEMMARENGYGFVLDIPHMFLHYVFNKKPEKDCYDDIPKLVADHLHISNTYFKQESLLDSVIYLLKGDINSAFVRLIGDFHLPLTTGHIDYWRVFKKFKVPETVIMEISSRNYELLKSSTFLPKKSSEDLVKKGYLEDVRYFKKLLAGKRRKIFINLLR